MTWLGFISIRPNNNLEKEVRPHKNASFEIGWLELVLQRSMLEGRAQALKTDIFMAQHCLVVLNKTKA